MEKNEKEKYEKELKKYERLGALKFQKVVFYIEKAKFKVLKKCFPRYIERVEKFLDLKQKRMLKKAKTEEERKAIRENIKIGKMRIRKEWHQEKNINYHMESKKPTEMIQFLEWNKSVHKKGLITNGILIPIAIAGIALPLPGVITSISIGLLGYELLSAAVNFECINIQNYNLCRIKRVKPYLQKREEKQIKQNIEEFGEAAAVIHKTIEQSESLPTFDEILDNINDPEQLRQMRSMFQRAYEERQAKKKIGGN